MTFIQKTAFFVLAFSLISAAGSSPPQGVSFQKTRPPVPSTGAAPATPAAAEDISGMYTFLKEGEFLQINLDQNGVSGYISRQGDLESDRGAFLDQFFSQASVRGHDVVFTTKPVHGVWFEFKGRFDRGPAKTKKEDGYYVVRGTLKEFTTGADKNTNSRSRQVEFKLLAQPDEGQ
ncbi:MAG TPA: hypothetical protein VG488_00290 [Candidatus Angelobacter sp.]|jgi:hypothetical protein|nr:hypothetical protein [Candidatus Angelobacter sp.]